VFGIVVIISNSLSIESRSGGDSYGCSRSGGLRSIVCGRFAYTHTHSSLPACFNSPFSSDSWTFKPVLSNSNQMWWCGRAPVRTTSKILFMNLVSPVLRIKFNPYIVLLSQPNADNTTTPKIWQHRQEIIHPRPWFLLRLLLKQN
jgi:hypothetical protein